MSGSMLCIGIIDVISEDIADQSSPMMNTASDGDFENRGIDFRKNRLATKPSRKMIPPVVKG